MAQAGVFEPRAAMRAEVSVTVAGVSRPVESMDWAGESSGGLPDQVVSVGTGMRSRTGTIRWGRDPVESTLAHPLRRVEGWPPREGDEVVISAVLDTGVRRGSWRRFTGRIGRTTGSLSDGTLASEITDMVGDRLAQSVTVDAIAQMPGQNFYLRSSWTAWRAMEEAGMGTLPPPSEPDVVLHLGGQSGNYVLVGSPLPGGAGGGGDGIETTSVMPAAPVSRSRSGGFIVSMARVTGAADSSLEVSLSNGRVYMLTYTAATREMTLLDTGGVVRWSGMWRMRESMPALVVAVGTSSVRVWTSLSTSEAVTVTDVSASVRLSELRGTGAVASIQARYASSVESVGRIPVEPVRIFRSGLETVRVLGTRSYENVRAREVVDAWSSATLAGFWADEFGVPQAVARDRLVARAPSRTVVVDERVFAGAWSRYADGVRSRVTVSGEMCAVQGVPGQFRATLYQEGSTRTFEASETVERFITAPAEEEWGPVDLVVKHPHGPGGTQLGTTAPSFGTWAYAVSTEPDVYDSPEWWVWGASYPGTYDVTIERLGQRTLKVTEDIVPPSGRVMDLKAANESAATSLRIPYRNQPSPIIRAEWSTSWAPYTVTGAATGPAWAPELRLNAGWWLHPDDAQRVADALADEVTQPAITLDGVETLWDPTRQIGDVETWIAHEKDGSESWRATVLVSGYSESWVGNVPSQAVDVRVIAWTDPIDGKTYSDLATAYGKYSNLTGTYAETFNALPERV